MRKLKPTDRAAFNREADRALDRFRFPSHGLRLHHVHLGRASIVWGETPTWRVRQIDDNHYRFTRLQRQRRPMTILDVWERGDTCAKAVDALNARLSALVARAVRKGATDGWVHWYFYPAIMGKTPPKTWSHFAIMRIALDFTKCTR